MLRALCDWRLAILLVWLIGFIVMFINFTKLAVDNEDALRKAVEEDLQKRLGKNFWVHAFISSLILSMFWPISLIVTIIRLYSKNKEKRYEDDDED